MHESANSQHKDGLKLKKPLFVIIKYLTLYHRKTVKGLIPTIKDIYNSTVKQDVTEIKSVELDSMYDALNRLELVVEPTLPY